MSVNNGSGMLDEVCHWCSEVTQPDGFCSYCRVCKHCCECVSNNKTIGDENVAEFKGGFGVFDPGKSQVTPLKSSKDAEIDELLKDLPLDRGWSYGGEYPGYSGGGNYVGGTTFVLCRHDPVHVIKGKKGNVYGGSRANVVPKLDDFDLIVNCTGDSDLKKHSIPIPALNKFEAVPRRAIEIVLDWPDMGVVTIDPEFWRELWKEIEKNSYKTLVYCVGGHGRTGTALACLLVATGYSAKDAIKIVRKVHCEDAIENKSQEEYVKKVRKDLWGDSKPPDKS